MEKFRISNDLSIFWSITEKDGKPYNLSDKTVRLIITYPRGRMDVTDDITIQDNVICWLFRGSKQRYLGTYKMTVEILASPADRMIRKDISEAFELVGSSMYEQTEIGRPDINDSGTLVLATSLDIFQIKPIIPQVGPNRNWWVDGVDTGKSSVGLTAYEFAKEQGYEGTVEEYEQECLHVPYYNELSRIATAESEQATQQSIAQQKEVSIYMKDVAEPTIARAQQAAAKAEQAITSIPKKTSQLVNDSGFITKEGVPASDWNASTYKEGHIKNRTHHMVDYMCQYFKGSPVKISKPSGVGYVLLAYDTDLADKFIRIEINANESKTHEFLDAMGMPIIFRWDAGASTINVESFGGAVETYSMRAYYSSSAKGFDEYFIALDEGFIPKEVLRKTDIATINGKSLTEGGNIVIEGKNYDNAIANLQEKDTQHAAKLTELSAEIGKVAPKVAPFLEAKSASLSAGQSLTLSAPNSYNHHVIGFSAELESGILTLSHGSLQYSFGRIAVDDTYIYEYSYGSGNATKATKHGISLAPFFICTIEKGDNPYYAHLTLTTPSESFTMQISWRGSSENVILAATGQHKNVSLYFSGEGYKMPIWIYADSYASYWYPKAYDARQTGMYVDAYSGRKSATALESLREGLKLGTPKAVVWAMGMNDADTSAINADYKSALDEVLSICEERHIKVVPVTIPNTPTQLHTFKNAYIKSLGIEYIDAAQTLGASEAGSSWYDGLLSADNVHPTENGANVYFRLLTECLGTLSSKQKLLGVTTKSNGNIIVEGLAATPMEFMKATPSGSPLHDAYILGGAKWNDTDEDVMVAAPWRSLVDTSEEENITHKARRWYYNGIGDLTNDDMAKIWGRGHYTLAENGALAYYGTNAVRTTRERTGMQSNTATFAYFAGYNDTIEVITLSIYAVLANSQNAPVTFNNSNPNGLFVRCGKLRHIFGQLTINTPVSGTFQGCKELRTLSLKGLKSNVTFADSPYLTVGSVAYMINNEASTGAITITLHATAYTRAMASEAVQTALASHTNVSLVSA